VTAPVPVLPGLIKEGKEKTIVSAVLGLIGGVLTAGSTFFVPDSTPGHIITAGFGLLTLIGVTTGVYMQPNTKVQVATTAVLDAAVDVGNQVDVDLFDKWIAHTDDIPDLPDDFFDVTGQDGDAEPDEGEPGAHRA
jgi:hypothetical protein